MRACFLLPVFAMAASASPERAVEILTTQCGGCHGTKVTLSGLDTTSRTALLNGGSRGPALKPGEASASRLYQAVTHQSTPAMPPGRRLPDSDLAVLKAWIDNGAQWPAGANPSATGWWSFRKPVRSGPPALSGSWIRNPIDAFVLQKLHDRKLAPAAEADRITLARRLYFDLHGLPPAPDEVQAFVEDRDPRAYEKLVDRLLASPRYGEKWGRHWLDLVRYSDTAGFELDSYIADAWRYRDWVIQSFNEDKPYDRFVREQIAGDEFFPEDPAAQTGTGYFCVGPNRDLFPDQADINRVETLTDYVDTTASVFLGLTMGCARCHDHKYDPIPQRDYYRMQAVFAPGVKTRVALNRLTSLNWEVGENVREIKLREIGEQIGAIQDRCREIVYSQKLAPLPAEVQEALRLTDSQRNQKQREQATQYGDRAKVNDDEIRACLSPDESERMHTIERRLISMFANYRSKPFACGFTDAGDHSPATHIPAKGGGKGPQVQPGFLTVLGGGDIPEMSFERKATGPIPLAPTTGRRKALADWLTDPSNPLTARVMVNRIWQFHFGRGIVGTPSDFGARGSAPSHPELLDWLASEFVAQGWSVKAMHRLILTSAAYRQSTSASGAARTGDPENVWLSHFSRRRLNAEEVRDSVLAVTGNLNLKAGGRPVVVPLSKEELFNLIGRPDDMWIVTSDDREHARRSIYLLQKRTFRMPMMEVFDAPESMLTCSRRDSSTTAPQSLTLMNSGFMMKHAAAMASGLLKMEDAEAVRAAWSRIFGRSPSDQQQQRTVAFLKAQIANTASRQAALTEVVRALLNVNEFLYVD
jgi:hypothetical protein